MDTSQLEYSIVGAICIEPKICDKISGILSPDDFSISACSEVFEAACDALGRGKHFDAVLAADAIRNRVDDAVRFIGDCMNVTPTLANTEDHARMLHQRASERGSSWRFRKLWKAKMPPQRSQASVRTSYGQALATAYRALDRR